jgi:ferredoxin-NADP reductase
LLCRIKVIALDANRFAVPRSYTISSENYVEITPKRMENGCVSVFLNEQAKPGLVAA